MAEKWLLIDAGNTRVKWAERTETELSPGQSFTTSSLRASASALDQVWAHIDRPLGVALSNVAGERVRENLVSYIRERWSIDVHEARSKAELRGFHSGYRIPESLGVDRWLAIIAAQAQGFFPALVVDAGSAMTIDVLDANGNHEGGYILPGRSVMVAALIERTKQIQDTRPAGQASLSPGCDTASGLASGGVLALVGAIERAYSLCVESKRDKAPVLILSGGDAEILETHLRLPLKKCSDLVLEGLWMELVHSRDQDPRFPPLFPKR